MANRGKKARKIKIIIGLVILIIVAILSQKGFIPIDEDSNSNEMSNKITAEESENILQIHFFDQTTPNMIQGLKGIFARKPLISIGI